MADSWENKAKFPPNLKPRLVQVATEALRLGEYNENFFNYLPKIFPYNRFTMMVRSPSLFSHPFISLIQCLPL